MFQLLAVESQLHYLVVLGIDFIALSQKPVDHDFDYQSEILETLRQFLIEQQVLLQLLVGLLDDLLPELLHHQLLELHFLLQRLHDPPHGFNLQTLRLKGLLVLLVEETLFHLLLLAEFFISCEL